MPTQAPPYAPFECSLSRCGQSAGRPTIQPRILRTVGLNGPQPPATKPLPRANSGTGAAMALTYEFVHNNIFATILQRQ